MSEPNKQYEVLQWAFSFLNAHGREEKIAEILLQHHLNISQAQFYASMQDLLPNELIEKYKEDIIAHAKTGIPVQHLTGMEYFYGRPFYVNKHVLIPRVETEELVEHVIKLIKEKYMDKPVTLVDIGTGSGIIAITLALELPNIEVYATDISNEALDVAKKNADKLNASVQFMQGDLLQPIMEKGIQPDIVVSNPPYISEADRQFLSDTVINFDPHIALFAKDDGLRAYKDITKQLRSHFQQDLLLCFEIGFNQAEAVTDIIQDSFPKSNIQKFKDINEKDRIVIAEIKK